MQHSWPIPKTVKLAETLAQRVTQLRELRNMTVRDLARRTKFGIKRIEDIQSGLETWLSSTDRQVLAKALIVEPAIIEEVETKAERQLSTNEQYMAVPEAVKLDLNRAILDGARSLNCPLCGNKLNCYLQHGFDIDDVPIQSPRAYCMKCPFVLR